MAIAYSTLLGSRAVGVSITPPLAPFNRATAIVSVRPLFFFFSRCPPKVGPKTEMDFADEN
jgi:hypothetical protein